MATLGIYLTLLGASLKGQLAYRRSFLLEAVGRFVVAGLELVAILFLFEQIDALGGWTRWEVVYLYGTASLSLGLAEFLTDGLNEVPALVQSGDFDRLLVRPLSPLWQLLGRRANLYHVGRVAQGGLALALALGSLEVGWGASQLAMLAITLAGSTLVYCSLFLLGAATCIWTVQSAELFNAFTYGGVQMTQYPVSIYRPWLRNLFIYLVPVGLVSYFPALVVLDKPDPLEFPGFMPWLALPVALLFAAAAHAVWQRALDHYRSTGS